MKINELSAAPLRVLPSVISAAKPLNKNSQIARLFLQASKINGFVIIIIVLPLLFWTDLVALLIVERPQVSMVVQILPVLAYIYGLYSLGATGFFTMIGLGMPIVNARWGLIGGVAECFLMILLIPRFGLLGGVLANAAYIIVIITNFYSVHELNINWKTYIKTIAPVFFVISFAFLFTFLPDFIRQNLAIGLIFFLSCVTFSIFFVIGPELFKRFFNAPRKIFFDNTIL
jgi:O-antigen/teichoic acid export membrane protein